MTRADIAKKVFDVSHLTGEFTLRSGITSTQYFDKYQFESDPLLLAGVVDMMADLLPDETEFLAGLEMGGIAIATALSLRTGIPAVFVRKEAKKYGTCKLAEGPDVAGKKIVIIEDVITSGGQVILSAADLKSFGADILTTVCVIDREQGGKQKMEAAGLSMKSVFTMTELLAV
ncbi:MAG: orotate phosphoribosyltransferase [Ignavibacteria bacterium]|nr:orotate phosphoribosyltransferase [Ignavibacteria bacterium]